MEKVTIIIPFLKGMDNEESLKYAMASYAKNLLNTSVDVVIMGDRPSFDNKEELKVIPLPNEIDSANEKLGAAVGLALMDESIPKEFLVAFPNTYLVNPVELYHLRLQTGIDYKKGDDLRVDQALQIVPLLDPVPSSALPFFVNKEDWADMITCYPELLDKDADLHTAYALLTYDGTPIFRLNWRADNILLPVISANTKLELLKSYAAGKMFVTNNIKGWNDALRTFLAYEFEVQDNPCDK